MGHLRLTVVAGKLSREVSLVTPNDDSAQDENVLKAMRDVAAIKDEGHAGELAELKTGHTAELDALNAEIKSLREPIIARVVLARTKERAGLDAAKEAEYFAGLPTPRLLAEDEYHNAPAETSTSKTSGEPPERLAAPGEELETL